MVPGADRRAPVARSASSCRAPGGSRIPGAIPDAGTTARDGIRPRFPRYPRRKAEIFRLESEPL